MPQPFHTNSPSRRFAFTLLELLVVIAIIAMLVAIGLPSMLTARQKGRQSACIANLRNIATASVVYAADDPQDWGIPVHPLFYRQNSANQTFIGAYEWGGKSGVGREDFLQPGGDPIYSKYGTMAGFGPATRPLNRVLYSGGFKDNLASVNRVGAAEDTRLELPIFRCPADDGPPRGAHCKNWIAHPDRSSYDQFGTSYAANLFMIAPCYPGSDGGGLMFPLLSNSPYLRPLSRVPNVSRTLFYEENIGRWAWATVREACPGLQHAGIDPGPSKAVRGWHGRDWTYNRSFIDGHAETQRIYEEGTEDAFGYAEHYRIEQLTNYPNIKFVGGEFAITWNSYG